MPMPRSVAAVLLGLVACQIPDADGFTSWQPEGTSSTSGPALPTTSGTSTGSDSTTTSGVSTGPFDPPDVSSTDSNSTAGDSTSETTGEIEPPTILEVAMPNPVAVAGPAGFTVVTHNATTVHAKLDGVELDPLTSEGDGVFAGAAPIYGSVDNGAHTLEVLAENDGPVVAAKQVPFTVATPAAGSLAWAEQGPPGSKTTRLALTAEGDVLEVGSLEVAGVPRPTIRKRSGASGALLWAEGTKVLDDRQGSAVGVAVTPDGRLWVAMNVREGNLWRAHFILLDAQGEPTGVFHNSYFGATVTAIASDHEGGYFAVGYVPSGEGDHDVAVWRMNKDHVPIFTGQPWDYVPKGWQEEHLFTDLAFDVVVQGDVAWIAGMSQGKHQVNLPIVEARGLLVRINIHTFDVLEPVAIAPEAGWYTQSTHNGISLHPEGVLVASRGCDETCVNQRSEVSLYAAGGQRLWHVFEGSGPVAYASAIAANKHGLALTAASMRDGEVLRGRMLGYVIHSEELPLDVWFPANQDNSATSSVVVGAYDEAFWGGYVTLAGVQRSYTVRLHQ